MIASDYFWFRLFRTRGIGPKRLVKIQREMEQNGLAPYALPRNKEMLQEQYPSLAKIILPAVRADDRDEILGEYERLRAQGISVVYPGHDDYPLTLIEDAERFGVSPVLLCKGSTGILRKRSVAIVGSRHIESRFGAKVARQIAEDLARRGINVVSGYARGVDFEAHLGALKAKGTTTAVLSYGILNYKAKENLCSPDDQGSLERILVISQFSPHEPWLARNAMVRNKLVCALSHALVVIECGPERDAETGRMSGTFHAALTALEMGRPLFVLSPDSLGRSLEGNKELIRRGGKPMDPAEAADKIIEALERQVNGKTGVAFRVGGDVLRQGRLFA